MGTQKNGQPIILREDRQAASVRKFFAEVYLV